MLNILVVGYFEETGLHLVYKTSEISSLTPEHRIYQRQRLLPWIFDPQRSSNIYHIIRFDVPEYSPASPAQSAARFCAQIDCIYACIQASDPVHDLLSVVAQLAQRWEPYDLVAMQELLALSEALSSPLEPGTRGLITRALSQIS
jgi:hypothetical protein